VQGPHLLLQAAPAEAAEAVRAFVREIQDWGSGRGAADYTDKPQVPPKWERDVF
jgi:hypothetical protein